MVDPACVQKAMNSQTQELEDKQQYYFMYLLWGTFGLSAVRFLGVSSGKARADVVPVLLGGEAAGKVLSKELDSLIPCSDDMCALDEHQKMWPGFVRGVLDF